MIRTVTFAAAIGAAAIVAAAGALSAAAQTTQTGPQGTPAPDGHMMMMRHHLADMDKNHDGYITRDEFLSRPSALFARFDTNGDGRLSKEELAAAHREHMACKQQAPGDAAAKDVPCAAMGAMGALHGMGGHGEHMAMMRRHMDMLDTDHDGRISFAELEAPLRRHFEMMDKNKDGFIEKDELPAGPMMVEKHVETHD